MKNRLEIGGSFVQHGANSCYKKEFNHRLSFVVHRASRALHIKARLHPFHVAEITQHIIYWFLV